MKDLGEKRKKESPSTSAGQAKWRIVQRAQKPCPPPTFIHQTIIKLCINDAMRPCTCAHTLTHTQEDRIWLIFKKKKKKNYKLIT